MAVPVIDKAAEVGINLNTIFTALVLAGILWVGTTLESIRDTLNKSATAQALMERDIRDVRTDLERHKSDPLAHARPVGTSTRRISR